MPRRSKSTAPGVVPEAICRLVADTFDVSRDELSRNGRGRAPQALARQVAMYLFNVICGLNFKEVGQHFGRDRTTASYAARVVEMKRDDPGFDAILSRLESRLAGGGAA